MSNQSAPPFDVWCVYTGMPKLDVTVFRTDDGNYVVTETFVVAVVWTSEAKRILAMNQVFHYYKNF